MTDLDIAMRFLSSLGIGLLLGLEREGGAGARAGLRTFALVALLGTLCALLADKAASPWLLPATALGLAAMMVSAYRGAGPQDDPGTTSTVALLLCFILGAAVWHGYQQLCVAIALTVTGLLYFKTELHGVTRHLSRQDWVSLLEFAAVTFVILPVLPDRNFGSLDALNPYRIWLMVVLISGLGFAGYLVLRVLGQRRGLPVVGVLGGLVSSTATTLAYSRHARAEPPAASACMVIVLAANAVVLVKLLAVAVMVAPQVLPALAPMLIGGLLGGVPLPLLRWRGMARAAEVPHPPVANPSELRVALGFGAVYAAVLLGLAWINGLFGTSGVYVMAVLSGLTDIDAITLSTLHLSNSGALSPDQAARAIALAYVASVGLKFGLVWSVAGKALARATAPGYLCVIAGMAAGLLPALLA